MASLLAIYGDNELCKKMIKVIFMISVDVIKHSGAHLTSKNRNLLSCVEALYMGHIQECWINIKM